MDLIVTPEAGLFGLFLSSFLAATLLPGGSEVVLVALLMAHPEQTPAALLLATLGNTLGGMTTYALGRLLPQHVAPQKSALAQRWGAPVLLLAWAPVVGDALCAAAGWLRLAWLPCLLWMAVGKGARYLFLAWLTL
ncbi:MAG: YqaA family protein [Rhodocyclaceae bacterium]|nr:YqaA family protein [Rhodocyclaceae bacterium]